MILVYTAVAGDYPYQRRDIKCFGGDSIFARPVMDAKRFKILPHLYCHESITIWTDANIWLLAEPEVLVERFLGDADMALFAHPARQTVWDEFAAIRQGERFQIPFLQRQLTAQEDAYRKAGLWQAAPLYECNVLIRRNNEQVNRVMDAWWSEICRWQWRDQVSLPYVLWKYGKNLRVRPIKGDVRKHSDFKYLKH